MKKMKTTLSVALSIIMLIGCFPLSEFVSAEDSDKVYTVFMADPSVYGEPGTNVTALSAFSELPVSRQTVYSGLENGDWYYSFTQNYKEGNSLYGGASHAKSGVDNSKKGTNYLGTEWTMSWIGNAAVLNALAGLIDVSVDYRITQTGAAVNQIVLYISGATEYGVASQWLRTSVTEFGVWKTAAATPDSIKNFYNGFLSFKAELGWNDTGKALGDVTVVTELRNIKLTVKESSRDAINAALEGTEFTFDKLIAPYLVNEAYEDLKNPDKNSTDTSVVWYANPDRAEASNGNDVTAEKPSDSELAYKTDYRTVKRSDADGVYYRTTMTVTGSGGDYASTIFKSVISSETPGFGWLDNADVVEAVSKYIYLGFQYRFNGNIPSGTPYLYVNGINGYNRCWQAAASITQSGQWNVYELKLLNTLNNHWYNTDIALNLYVWQQSFSGTQRIDIRDLRFELKAADRVYLNKDLSMIEGIDDIEGFTKGVELENDVNGIKDYYSLLVSAASGTEFDVDDDGSVTVKDLIRVKKYDSWLIYLPDMMIKRADADDDGFLDAADIVLMKKALLSK